jgi:hypothetical protein
MLFPFKAVLLIFVNCIFWIDHIQIAGSEVMDETEMVWRGKFKRSDMGYCLIRYEVEKPYLRLLNYISPQPIEAILEISDRIFVYYCSSVIFQYTFAKLRGIF